MKINKQIVAKYIRDAGEYCPFCGDDAPDKIIGNFVNTNQQQCIALECDSCKKKWNEVLGCIDIYQ